MRMQWGRPLLRPPMKVYLDAPHGAKTYWSVHRTVITEEDIRFQRCASLLEDLRLLSLRRQMFIKLRTPIMWARS
jgi:hypothetical protein